MPRKVGRPKKAGRRKVVRVVQMLPMQTGEGFIGDAWRGIKKFAKNKGFSKLANTVGTTFNIPLATQAGQVLSSVGAGRNQYGSGSIHVSQRLPI